MKPGVCCLALSALALIACAGAPVNLPAQTAPSSAATNARWVGVWEGRTKDLPGLTLTLGDDSGDVAGTIVDNVMRDGVIVGHMAHVLLRPHVDGNTFSFQVKDDRDPAELLDISLELTGGSTALLHCPKCGATPFLMAMERIP
ncbi:MAG: hypothetical protein WBE76_11110 [Terracidiphilus sp.]